MKDKELRFIVGVICLAFASLIIIAPVVSAVCNNVEPLDCDTFNRTNNAALGNTEVQGGAYGSFVSFPNVFDNRLNMTSTGQIGAGIDLTPKYNNATFWWKINTTKGTTWSMRYGDITNEMACWYRILLNGTIGYQLGGSVGDIDTTMTSTGININATNDYIWFVSYEDVPSQKCNLYLYNTSGYNMWNKTTLAAGEVINPIDHFQWLFHTSPSNPLGARAFMDEWYLCSGLNLTCHSPFISGGGGSSAFYSSVSLNKPSDGNRTINFTGQINFTFTPLFNETIINCSLFTNESGVWLQRANLSAVVNSTINSMVPRYNTTDTEGNILWNIRCVGASSDVFATGNFTLNIDRTAPSISFNYPMANIYELNRSFFNFNYTVTDYMANLYKGNISMYYANGTFLKNVLFYNDLNVSTLTEKRLVNWSEELTGVSYFIEACFSDDEAASPPMKFLKSENTGIFKQNKDELHITDSVTGADFIVYLEFSDNSKVSKSELDLINFKTKDDKHVIYGGSYPKNKVPKDTRFRYRYHSNNGQTLKIIDASIGLIHSESGGMRNIFIQHRSLLEKGFYINTFYSGSDVIVEFWKDSYKDIIDFEPLIGGLNINCLNSSNITKPWFLNLNASDYYNGANITNFSVTITNGDSLSGSTTNGTLFFPTKNATYTINATAKGFIPYSGSVSIGQDTNKTLLFKRNNSIYIEVKDESTAALITENITARVNNLYGEVIYYTTTGTYYLYDLVAADYIFSFSSTSYDERSFNLTIGEGNSSTLTAYLAKNTAATLMTVLDSDTAATIEGASITMQKTINSSWSTVETHSTDITGRAQFNYAPLTKYKFIVTKTGYTTKTFELNPVLFSSYDVYIEKILSLNNSMDYDKVVISIMPTTYESGTNVFTIVFYSPYDNLLTYGYNLSYPSGVAGGSGTTAAGGSFSRAINITPQPFDTVTLNYFYQSDVSGFKNFTVSYPINYVNNETYNFTMMSNKNKTYGMGLLERVLIATLIIIGVVGLGSLFGKTLPALVIGLFMYGYLSYIGFIPYWVVILPIVAGIFILLFGGDKFG